MFQFRKKTLGPVAQAAAVQFEAVKGIEKNQDRMDSLVSLSESVKQSFRRVDLPEIYKGMASSAVMIASWACATLIFPYGPLALAATAVFLGSVAYSAKKIANGIRSVRESRGFQGRIEAEMETLALAYPKEAGASPRYLADKKKRRDDDAASKKNEKMILALYGAMFVGFGLWIGGAVAGRAAAIKEFSEERENTARQNEDVVGIKLSPWLAEELKKGNPCEIDNVKTAFEKALKQKLDTPAVSPSVQQVYGPTCAR